MLWNGRISAVGGLVFALLIARGSPCEAAFTVLPPHSVVEGKSIGEYSAEWWRWALAFSTPNDPFSDATGALAGLGQSGPVFFLAGTGGSTATRSFTVPAGKYLLVPLLVGEISQLEIGFDKTAAEVRQAAREQADLIDELHASIDGVAVPDLFGHREASPDFSFLAAANNPIGVPEGASGIAVADGYFLMLSPLQAGETHVLNFGGGITEFGFSVDVTATITAVPEPGTLLMSSLGLAVLIAAGGRGLVRGTSARCPGRERI